MKKNSKRLNRAIKNLRGGFKKLFSKIYHLPPEKVESLASHIADLPGNLRIPPKYIAKVNSEEDEELKKIIINLDYLDFEKCNFDGIDINAFLKRLQYIGSLKLNEFPKSGIERDTIRNRDPYKFLFSDLPSDIDTLKEAMFSGEGRIFYFFVRENLCIVSIWKEHINID